MFANMSVNIITRFENKNDHRGNFDLPLQRNFDPVAVGIDKHLSVWFI